MHTLFHQWIPLWPEFVDANKLKDLEAVRFERPHLVIFKDWRLTALQMSFTFSVAVYVVVKSLLLWSVIQYEEKSGEKRGEFIRSHGVSVENLWIIYG